MDFKTILLLGTAGYFAWRQFAGNDAPASPVVATPDTPAVPTTIDARSETRARILEALAKAGGKASDRLSWWQWNWYYASVRGAGVPDGTVTLTKPNEYLYSLDEWFALLPPGLSGLWIRR